MEIIDPTEAVVPDYLYFSFPIHNAADIVNELHTKVMFAYTVKKHTGLQSVIPGITNLHLHLWQQHPEFRLGCPNPFITTAHLLERLTECRDFEDLTPDDLSELMYLPKPDFAWLYSTDMAYVDRSLGVLAWVSKPSFGVGMEIQRAHDQKKPVLLITGRPSGDESLSLMVRGMQSTTVIVGGMELWHPDPVYSDSSDTWRDTFTNFALCCRNLADGARIAKEEAGHV